MMGNEQTENAVPKIYAAILGVMNEVGAVSKEKTCKSNFGSYKFRGIDDVMNALHPAMVKNRVFAIPEILEMTREVKTSAKGTPMTSSICKIRYDFFTDDGSKVSCTVIGEGMDTGDKATNKAMSIAFKYACFQTFCIPTEDMDDPDAERPEETADQRKTGTEPKAGQKRKSSDVKQGEKSADQKQAEKPSEEEATSDGTQKITAAMLAAIRAEQKRTKVEDKTILGMRAIKAKRMEDMTVEEFKVVMHKFELTRTPEQEGANE